MHGWGHVSTHSGSSAFASHLLRRGKVLHTEAMYTVQYIIQWMYTVNVHSECTQWMQAVAMYTVQCIHSEQKRGNVKCKSVSDAMWSDTSVKLYEGLLPLLSSLFFFLSPFSSLLPFLLFSPPLDPSPPTVLRRRESWTDDAITTWHRLRHTWMNEQQEWPARVTQDRSDPDTRDDGHGC